MDRFIEETLSLTRRHFFGRASAGIGIGALSALFQQDLAASEEGLPGLPHFAPKAKRVIYLFQSGAPVSNGALRPQAQVAAISIQRAPRFHPPRPAAHWDDVHAKQFPRGSIYVQVCAARQIGCLDKPT